MAVCCSDIQRESRKQLEDHEITLMPAFPFVVVSLESEQKYLVLVFVIIQIIQVILQEKKCHYGVTVHFLKHKTQSCHIEACELQLAMC